MKTGNMNFGRTLWPMIKKEWPDETDKLEKKYNEKLYQELKDKIITNISKFGVAEWDQNKEIIPYQD